jgi:putative (di)nucleoside polyphosphate hydrolase
VSKLWNGKYKGQKQKWFLIKFTGNDADIDIQTDNPEFREWCWADTSDLPQLIVPFKKLLYDAVLEEFTPLISDLLKK